MKSIMIVDDEISIRTLLRISLMANGYSTIEAKNADEALKYLKANKVDAIILDYGLPDKNGLELLREIRDSSNTPVIFLTVRSSEHDKVNVLDSGADDYLVKPFSMVELLARVRVVIRNSHKDINNPSLIFGKLLVDIQDHKIYFDDIDLQLTSTEFSLLKLLVQNGERLVSHQQILKEIWGPNSVEHLHYLRVYF